MYGCGHCYYKTHLKGDECDIPEGSPQEVQSLLPSAFGPEKVQLYSAYLGLITVPVYRLDNNNVLLMTNVEYGGRMMNVKLIDSVRNGLDPKAIQYVPARLATLPSQMINLTENRNAYFTMLKATEEMSRMSNVPIPKVVQDEVSALSDNEEVVNSVKEQHPFLFGAVDAAPPPFVDYKALRKSCLEKLCPVDILFGMVEYLQFLYAKIGLVVFRSMSTLICLTNIPNFDNAFWTGSYMVCGNGQTMFNPLGSLDVIGHELTHGLVGETANLQYLGHAGALNESFSDVVGSCFEFHVYDKYNSDAESRNDLSGYPNWLMGEVLDINLRGKFLRNMQFPELGLSPQPSKYKGQYYVDPNGQFDYGGVHINSGIPNHCFYLVTQLISRDVALRLFISILLGMNPKSDFMDFRNMLKQYGETNSYNLQRCLLDVALTPEAVSDWRK